MVGVGGVVIDDGRVLLIRRGKDPGRGRWSLPGGTVEAGETLQQALVREMREETLLEVRVGPLLLAFDRIERAGERLLYHYVILDYLCQRLAGQARAASDAEALAWARPEELERYELAQTVLDVVAEGFRRAASLTEPAETTAAPA